MKTRFDWALGAHNVFGLSSSLGTPIWRESILRWCLGLRFFLGVSFLYCQSRSHCEGFF